MLLLFWKANLLPADQMPVVTYYIDASEDDARRYVDQVIEDRVRYRSTILNGDVEYSHRTRTRGA